MLLVAPVGSMVEAALTQPVVGLLLSGDLALAGRLLPEALVDGGAGMWAAIGAAALGILILWARLYAPAVWLSDDEHPKGIRDAWRATSRSWRPVAWIYLHGWLIQIVLAAVLLTAGFLVDVALPIEWVAGVLVFLIGRTLMRVWQTVAVRKCVLEGAGALHAWRAAAGLVARRRADAVAAWIGLATAGIAITFGWRLVSPILQDGAYSYPRLSPFDVTRHAVQDVVQIPLHAFLLVLGVATWTGFFKAAERPARQGRDERSGRVGDHPLVVRGLAGVAVLTLLGNGGAVVVEEAWARKTRAEAGKLERRESSPEDAVRTAPAGGSAPTRYNVEAQLSSDDLEWSTDITYLNRTGASIEELPLNVYPAAYTRAVEHIPLAAALIAADPLRRIESRLNPGELTVDQVRFDGRDAQFKLNSTVLRVVFDPPLQPEATAHITVDLHMQLPVFPERFGLWENVTLLGNWIPTVPHNDGAGWRLYPFTGVGDPFLSDTADYEVAITATERSGVVGSGALTAVEPAGGNRRTWRFSAPASRDAAYAVAPGLRGLRASAGEVTVRSWYTPDDRDEGRHSLRVAASTAATFARLFGDLPHDEIEVVVTHGFLGGMEYPGVVFVAGDVESQAAIPEITDIVRYAGFKDALQRHVTAHEVAHQWWYAAVGNDPVREPWLDEALAEMSVRLWLRAAEGNERDWMMANLRSEVEAKPGVLRGEATSYKSNSAYVEDLYLSGSQALIEFARSVGRAPFESIIRTYYEASAGEVATTEDFMDAVRARTGARGLKLFLGYF